MKKKLVYLLLLLPIIRVSLLLVTYSIGHEIAESIGREYRGGYAWGLTLELYAIGFAVLSFIEGAVVLKFSRHVVLAGLVTSVLFIVSLAVQVGYTGGWSHPYRLAYYQFCGVVAIWLPIAIVRLTSPSKRQARDSGR